MDNARINDYRILYESLKDRYCRLLFITGPSDGKSDFWKQIQGRENQIHVSRELVTALHHLPDSQCTKAVTDYFAGLEDNSATVFLPDMEILFDGSLKVDPGKLLKHAARNRAMVVDWPGTIDFSANTLTYAEPGHCDYYSTELTDDVLFFDVSGRSSLNRTAGRS